MNISKTILIGYLSISVFCQCKAMAEKVTVNYQSQGLPSWDLQYTVESNGQSVDLIDVRQDATLKIGTEITADVCQYPKQLSGSLPIQIGVFPLADQPLSKSLVKQGLGSGEWPKPMNMPKLVSWTIKPYVDFSKITTQKFNGDDLVKQIQAEYENQKSNGRYPKPDIEELGFVTVKVPKSVACDLLSGAIQFFAVVQIETIVPETKTTQVLTPTQIEKTYNLLDSRLGSKPSVGVVRANYELAKALSEVVSVPLTHKDFLVLSRAVFGSLGELKVLSSLDKEKLGLSLTKTTNTNIKKQNVIETKTVLEKN